MNKNKVIGFILIFAILIGYMIIVSPSKEEMEQNRLRQDSIANVKKNQDSLRKAAAISDSIATIPVKDSVKVTFLGAAETTDSAVVKDSLTAKDLFAKYGFFYDELDGNDSVFTVENDLLSIDIASKGGYINQVRMKDFSTWDQRPLEFYKKNKNFINLSFSTQKNNVSTSALYFTPLVDSSKLVNNKIVVDGDSLVFAMKAAAKDENGNEVGAFVIRYIIPKDSYMIKFSYVFENSGKFMPFGATFMNMNWKADINRQEKSLENERLASTVYYCDNDLDVDYLSERKDDEENITTSLKWLSFKQQFFCSALIADDKIASADIKSSTQDTKESTYLKTMQADMSLEYNPQTSESIDFSFYFGPTKYKILHQYDLNLDEQIPLGWSFAPLAWINRFIVIPIFNWLESYALSYGIIILILTIMLKIVLFPIAVKTYKSSAKMRVLKPEMDEIAKKYPKQEDAMKKQQVTMELYKKAGVSPMSGCLPMLLQFPILIAMFRFFPASIELRQQPFLWADDLSSYDSILDLGFNIPFYGDHVSLFCLLMTISTVIYTYINNKMMSSANQMPGMKLMMYMMPILFLGVFNNYSSGLSYYYLLANIITFIQMFVIRKLTDENKLRALIEANKKKTPKKSKFQKKLEEAAKARGIQTR